MDMYKLRQYIKLITPTLAFVLDTRVSKGTYFPSYVIAIFFGGGDPRTKMKKWSEQSKMCIST